MNRIEATQQGLGHLLDVDQYGQNNRAIINQTGSDNSIWIKQYGSGHAAAFAGDQTLAEFHVENGGCDSCHQDVSPSADGAYEFEQCQSCHGTLAEMDDVHKPHDNNVGQKPTCDSCHDDGRTSDSVLKK
ncbi:cytochrome c3 family protein [Shewanella sp.]|uniref:cytochrome c3 family protein n=1 Tax=Shewanella sp. TaxID=50422 RepID=UPI00356326BB